jgi:hypothetical protein
VLGDLPGRQPQGRALENSEPPDRCDALAARVVGEKERDMRAERDEERATFSRTQVKSSQVKSSQVKSSQVKVDLEPISSSA